MSRHITDHVVSGDPAKQLTIEVTDAAGAGGANHRYELTGFDTASNPSRTDSIGYTTSYSRLVIMFQNGPIGEAGVNGITQEALLAIVVDRLASFQAGPYACHENAMALVDCESALEWLHMRTKERLQRKVEGLSKA
jgi:hypothetical protein